MTSPDDIDALLAAPKTLAGSPGWAKDERGTVSRLAAPVAQAGVVGALILQAHATLHTEPQRGGCVLVLDGRPIQRLSFKPGNAHANPPARAIPRGLRALRLPPDVSRIYPWPLNRRWPRSPEDNVVVGQPLEPEPESFHAALTLFLDLCGIEGVLPPPPWEPRLL